MVRRSLTSVEAVQRFQREASIRIDHPNVVRVLEAGTSQEGPFIAFELLSGETLLERLERQRRFSSTETLHLALQATSGLVAAHDAGVVHRDLKPSNLFLTDDDVVKLIDFGVARLQSPTARLTANGQVVGTLNYLSREQAERRGEVVHRSDLWSLGAVLYECLAGRPPFPRGIASGDPRRRLGEPEPLASAAPDCGPELDAIVRRLLAKRPAARFTSARELLAALEEARSRPSTPHVVVPATLRPDEQRTVVVMYALGVRDPALVTASIREARGTVVELPDGLLGLFASDTTLADDVARATTAAIEARGAVERVAVSAGRATGASTGITGTAIEAAEQALTTRVEKVALSADAARGLKAQHLLTPRNAGCVELTADLSALDALRVEPALTPLVGRSWSSRAPERSSTRSPRSRAPACSGSMALPGSGNRGSRPSSRLGRRSASD